MQPSFWWATRHAGKGMFAVGQEALRGPMLHLEENMLATSKEIWESIVDPKFNPSWFSGK